MNTEILKISHLQDEEDATIATKDKPIEKQTKLLPFDVKISLGEEGGFDSIGSENKSTISVQFKFTRSIEGRRNLITGYYIPTGLFATLSLISYLIKPEIVPGRMALLVTLFLVLINIFMCVR